jgi:hypothetical protein
VTDAEPDRPRDAMPPPALEPPPFWRTWRRLYWLVAGALVADIVVFWLLARWAA